MRVERFSFRELGGEIAVGSPDAPTSFTPIGKKKAASVPPPPPVFTEEQMKEAERDGYKKGFLEGTQEGKNQAESEQADTERKLLQSVQGFAETLTPLINDYREMALRVSEHMPKIAMAIARKVAVQALSENAHVVIENLAAQCCQAMLSEPKLTITVHARMADTLTKKIEQVAAKLPDHCEIIVLSDPEMPPADCRIEWNRGVLERRTDQLWHEIEQLVESMSSTGSKDTETQMDALRKQITSTVNNERE